MVTRPFHSTFSTCLPSGSKYLTASLIYIMFTCVSSLCKQKQDLSKISTTAWVAQSNKCNSFAMNKCCHPLTPNACIHSLGCSLLNKMLFCLQRVQRQVCPGTTFGVRVACWAYAGADLRADAAEQHVADLEAKQFLLTGESKTQGNGQACGYGYLDDAPVLC